MSSMSKPCSTGVRGTTCSSLSEGSDGQHGQHGQHGKSSRVGMESRTGLVWSEDEDDCERRTSTEGGNDGRRMGMKQ